MSEKKSHKTKKSLYLNPHDIWEKIEAKNLSFNDLSNLDKRLLIDYLVWGQRKSQHIVANGLGISQQAVSYQVKQITVYHAKELQSHGFKYYDEVARLIKKYDLAESMALQAKDYMALTQIATLRFKLLQDLGHLVEPVEITEGKEKDYFGKLTTEERRELFEYIFTEKQEVIDVEVTAIASSSEESRA